MLRSSASGLLSVPKVLETSFHHWRSIMRQVMESGVVHRGVTLTGEERALRPSVPWTVLLILFQVYFTLRSAIVLAGFLLDTTWIRSAEIRLILGVEIYPRQTRFMLETAIFFCSLYSLAAQAFMLTRKLDDFRFFTILAIDKSKTIRPSTLGIKVADYQKLSVLVDSCIGYARLLSLLNIGYSGLFYYTSWKNRLFRLHLLPLTLLHIFASHYWVAVISSALFYHPLVLSTLIHYHRLKAASILAGLSCFDKCLHKRVRSLNKNQKLTKQNLNCKAVYYQSFNNLTKRYVRFMEEVKEYQRHYWSHYLSLLFVFSQVIITYLLCLCFMEKFPNLYRWGMYLLTTVLTTNLVLVIYFCRFIYTINRSMAQGLYNLNFRLQQLRWYQPREYLKLETNCLNIRNKPDGFTLFNGQLINSKTFVEILFNVSAFFCLLFKNKLD